MSEMTTAHICVYFDVCKVDEHYYPKSYKLMRKKKKKANATSNVFIACKGHGPLHKLGFAEFPIEKVLGEYQACRTQKNLP